jgi:hypothetical protein
VRAGSDIVGGRSTCSHYISPSLSTGLFRM